MTSPEFRSSYAACRDVLRQRLSEPAPGRIQLLTGPRQVGKTTVLLELAAELRPVAVYIAADSAEASLPGYLDRVWVQAEELAELHGRAVVLLDEVHALPDWAGRLKAEWDRLRRRRIPVHVVASGSSALRLAGASRESLAGRFERMTLTHWTVSSLAEVFGLDPAEAAEQLVRRGGYPGAMAYRDDPDRWAAYVRDAIVEPAIGRDILALGAVRKPGLLRQVFAVCTGSPAGIVSLQKIQGRLQDSGALETIAHYLELLEEAYLVAAVRKYSARAARRRSAPPKLITLSNALLAVSDPLGSPDAEAEPARFGAWLENACLAHAWNSGQTVMYWREEPFEVDGVISGSWGSWAVEVKTGHVALSDLRPLLEFHRRQPQFRPLLIADARALPIAARAGIDATSWQDFLVAGPPSGT